MSHFDLSFVFPCLNEEETMEYCILELKNALEQTDINYEIIVSDNGSTDRSVEIAKTLGARVVYADKRGYGEALKKGFAEAKGKFIAFADIDGSYPLSFLPEMYKKIVEEDADMVVASRMKGIVEKGAMPFLHRYLGTPVLTKLINLFFRGKLSDCNSGFRIFKKESYEKWNVNSSGMEFASELLIKVLKHKGKVLEIPAGLRPDKRSRKPHLRTWRDGMRHLLFILSETPKFFEWLGISFVGLATVFYLMSIILGVTEIGNVVIFDYHSKLLLLFMMIIGLQFWFFSAFLYVSKADDKPTKLTNYLIQLKEEMLFLFCLLLMMITLCLVIVLVSYWGAHNFQNMHLIHPLLDISYWIIFFFLSCMGLMQIHILKRTINRGS